MEYPRDRKKILLIDDSFTDLELFREILSGEEEYDAFFIDNPLKVKALIEKGSFDLVITDIMMPGMDGLQLIDYLNENCKAPVIVCSSVDELKVIREVLDKGAGDYIVKPINISDFLAKIHLAFQKTRQVNASNRN